jgi:hypothetical protein
MLKRNKKTALKAAASGVLAIFLVGNAFASPVDESIVIEKQLVKDSSKAQSKIDRFAEKTIELSADYKQTLQVIEQLQVYNKSLETVIESQEKEMLSIQAQMDSIDATERGVVPLMNEMIESIDQFVGLDMPFLKDLREKRVNDLKNVMIRADISNSEKYRKILIAYQTEIAYGESFGTYEGTINLDGMDTKVDFLRVGRVALIYITLDGQHAGHFNFTSGSYEQLDDEYLRGIEVALKFAKGNAAPELLKLPVPTSQGAN